MRRLLAVCLVLTFALLPSPIGAASPETAIPNGYFFTQTGSGDGTQGFAVVDDEQARFWSEFQRLGGVSGLGYPVSHRFLWDGFVVQVMQKGVLQWRPEAGRAFLVNVFDRLSTAGKDDWLFTVRSTPRPLAADFDEGRTWDQIVTARLALLDANPALRARYFSAPDPLTFYGLPTSPVVDQGDHDAIRLQRAVIQQWKVAVPWAAPGQVTVANGGDVAKEARLFPTTALEPAPADPSDRSSLSPSSRGGTRPLSSEETALQAVNRYRALAGAPPLTLDDSLTRAAAAHASYYVQNYGDPGLAGMGLHRESPARPGFTGASWTDRARAAGYRNTTDENIGLVGKPQTTVDWFIATVNHRWNLLHPSAVHLGYGIATRPAIDVFDIGFSQARPDVPLPTVYPGDGQQGIPPSAEVRETPDPAPGVPRPLGFPITISFHTRDSVRFDAFSLVDAAGQPAQLYTTQKAWLRSLALIPARPLRAGETYTASVSGIVNGQPFTKTWSFTTR